MSLRISLRSLRTYAPTSRFSSTVSSGNVPRPCGTWAIPSLAICSGRLPTSSVPFITTLPLVPTIWQIARIVVVLPAPLAPSSTTTSPSSTCRSRPRSTWTGP